jgi:hypothetical protein
VIEFWLGIAVTIIQTLGPVVLRLVTSSPAKDAIELLDEERIANILPAESRLEMAQQAARLTQARETHFAEATPKQLALIDSALSLIRLVAPTAP